MERNPPPTRLDSRPGWPASATDGARARSPSSTARDLKLAWKQHRERREEGGEDRTICQRGRRGREVWSVNKRLPLSLLSLVESLSLSLFRASAEQVQLCMHSMKERRGKRERVCCSSSPLEIEPPSIYRALGVLLAARGAGGMKVIP